MRFVHWQCLKKWVRMEPAANGRACTICKLPFKVHIFPGLEEPSLQGVPRLAQLFVERSYLCCVTLVHATLLWNVSQVVQEGFFSPYTWGLVRGALLTGHGLYAVSFAAAWTVRNRRLYARMILRSQIPVILLAHLYSLYSMAVDAAEQDYLSVGIMYLLLQSYWVEHKKVLERMNQALLD